MTRWARYTHEGAVRFGTLDDDVLHEHEGDMFEGPRPTGRTVPLAEVELLNPVTPTKMIALANNFRALIAKTGGTVPDDPLYLLKAPNSFHPPEKTIRRPASYAGKVIFEGELGLVIGRACHAVSPDDALDHLFGCTCVNDVTAIEILNANPGFAQWTRCKAFDTFGVFGPVVATGLDPGTLSIRTVLDGQERQNYPVSDMVFTPADLISRLSQDMTLHPGDIISCGTSVGVGSMKPGSVVEVSIEGVGTLRSTFDG